MNCSSTSPNNVLLLPGKRNAQFIPADRAKVLWTGESKLKLSDSSRGRVCASRMRDAVHRPEGLLTVKLGCKSAMVWGHFDTKEVDELRKVIGIMDGKACLRCASADASLRAARLSENAPQRSPMAITSSLAIGCPRDHWPSQSSGSNPVAGCTFIAFSGSPYFLHR